MLLSSKKRLAKLALFATALIWGSSFFVVKNTVDTFPPALLLAIRFSIGCVLLSIVFCKRFRAINRSYLACGALLGVAMFASYYVQTLGLTDTSPGKNAFLTAIYCVLVPFLYWLIGRQRPDRYNFMAAFLCIAGIGFVSLTDDFSIGLGDSLTLASGVLFGVHIVLLSLFTKERDPVLLTIIQFGVAALLGWIVSLATETFPQACSTDSLLGIAFLGVFATTLAILLQSFGQKFGDPSSSAIIMSLEAVFGVIFSMLFYGEQLTIRLVVGFALIFLSVLISETKLSFLTRRRT